MIVTCPSCSARYLVETQKLGAQGRMVRCGSCQHTWYQAPPEGPLPKVEMTAPPPALAPSTIERRNLPAIPRRRWSGRKIAGLLMAPLVLMAVAWGAIFMRDRVMAAFPQTAQIYSGLGLAANTSEFGSGIEVRAAARRAVDNGETVLVIDGRIVNLSSSPRRVPPLKVTLRDANDKPLVSWTFSAGIAQLAPGASAPFHTVYQHPNADATSVVVMFENR